MSTQTKMEKAVWLRRLNQEHIIKTARKGQGKVIMAVSLLQDLKVVVYYKDEVL